MKKTLMAVGLATLCIAGITGCSDEPKTLTCTRHATGDVNTDFTYKISYSGEYIKKIHTVEKFTTQDILFLDATKSKFDNIYKYYREIDGYDNTVQINGDTLTSTTTLDYTKIDTNKMLELDSSNALLIKNGKVKVADMQKLYEEQVGAICK